MLRSNSTEKQSESSGNITEAIVQMTEGEKNLTKKIKVSGDNEITSLGEVCNGLMESLNGLISTAKQCKPGFNCYDRIQDGQHEKFQQDLS